MNIQHTQQIQHIRHAKDYQNQSSAFRRNRSARDSFAVVVSSGAVAVIIAAASAVPASATRPAEEGSAPVRALTQTAVTQSSSDTVSSPCFMARTMDRWDRAGGDQPRCTTTYGASIAFGAEGTGAQPERSARQDPFVLSADHIYGYDAVVVAETDGWAHHLDRAAVTEENTAPAAETDGWMHHIGRAAVTEENTAPAETDGWSHHIRRVSVQDGPLLLVASGQNHWRNCFAKARSFHAWEQVQIGMPKCAPYYDIPSRRQ